jgi:hypothetical protein
MRREGGRWTTPAGGRERALLAGGGREARKHQREGRVGSAGWGREGDEAGSRREERRRKRNKTQRNVFST